MHIGRSGCQRLRRRRAATGATSLILGAFLGLFPAGPTATAATTVVDCDVESDDITAVQTAVDSATPGDTVALAGTCDFAAAPDHGGSTTAIDAAAVVVRSASAGTISDLTITAAGSGTTTIRGDGTETAFAVLPGNTDVTISDLHFESLARPVVVLGAEGTTVVANRFDADHRANSTVLAVASGAVTTVRHGPDAPSMPSVTVTPSALRDLAVTGNEIFYTPPAPQPAAGTDVVGIDVRQNAGGSVDGVTIDDNTVAMFTGEFSSVRHNAVRVQGLEAVPASPTPAIGDYRITDVTITGNTLGRLEDLEEVPPGVDPSKTHAAGRVGILLVRVGDFEVTANRVRARLGTTGGPGVPGGGIVVSDSAFGAVRGDNRSVVVFADLTVPESADLGAIAVMEGLPRLFGDAAPDQATTGVDVTGNVVGALAGTNVETGRGIVLTGGVEDVTVWANTVNARAKALYVGAAVLLNGQPLSSEVDTSVLCDNVLDGTADDPAEVAFGSDPGSAGNAFPGGSAGSVRDVAPHNGECTPTVQLVPATDPQTIGPGESLDVVGRAWGNRTVSVSLRDEDGTVLTSTGTASVFGEYAVTLSDTELATLDDGILEAVVTAEDPAGVSRVSDPATVRKDVDLDPPGLGTVVVDDGGDGFTNAEEIVLQSVLGRWTASPDPVVGTIAWWSEDDGTVPSKCGPFAVSNSGQRALPESCGRNLGEGTFRFNVRWEASDGETAVAYATSVKDTMVDAPTITGPTHGSTLTTSTVDVAGTTTEPNSTVRVTRKQAGGSFAAVATTVSDGTGAWSAPGVPFGDGTHEISAYAVDPAGNRGTSAAPITITVDTGNPDTTPPAAPVVSSPADGSLQRGRFSVVGTAEPLSTVRVYAGNVLAGQAGADANGRWVAGVNLPSGAHVLDADATDTAGNTGARSAPALTVDVDATNPTLTITSPQQSQVFLPGDSVLFEGTAGDNLALARVSLKFVVAGDGNQQILAGDATVTCSNPCTSATWEFDASGLPPGAYDVTVGAVDSVVNYTTKIVRILTVVV
jgi:hypothetical protein